MADAPRTMRDALAHMNTPQGLAEGLQYRGGMSARPDPGFNERVVRSFQASRNFNDHIAGVLADKVPRIDPATGRLVPEAERRQERVARWQAEDARVAPPPARTSADHLADRWGGVASQMTAAPQAALALTPMAPAVGVGLGALYEGGNEAMEQRSMSGAVRSPYEVGRAALIGGVAGRLADKALPGHADAALGRSVAAEVTERPLNDAHAAGKRVLQDAVSRYQGR